MIENLVIVESPGKTGTVQKYLGNNFVVKASKGHIRDLREDALSVDVANNFRPEYIIPDEKKRLVAELKKEAKEAGTVWLASDDDREGEAIAWHLAETLELDPAKTRRVVFPEITKDVVQQGMANPRSIDYNLVNAQQARRVLDRLVGYELSPVLWRNIQPRLSAGRVQSVGLRLIVDREREIMNFSKELFYRVEASFHPEGVAEDVTVKATLDKKFPDIESARQFLQESIGAEFRIKSVERKEGQQSPAAPFTTSTLQQEASRKLHFSVNQIMSIAQRLYESGYITYMRTDSTNLSSLAINTAKQYIRDTFGEAYSHPRQYATRSKTAQEAHEAIRPTYIDRREIEGSSEDKRLYELIWKRTVASQMSSAKVIRTDITTESSARPELFISQGTRIVFDGFRKIYVSEDDNQEECLLPDLQVGTAMYEKGISAATHFTQPPLRYTEGSFIKKLEELGIGRPSTYAPTVLTLTKGRGYVVKGDKEGQKVQVTNLLLKNGRITTSSKTEVIGAEKGKLLPQEIGIQVADYLSEHFPRIMDYDFTAEVEKDFDRIAGGEAVWNDVIAGFYSPFHETVDGAMHTREFTHVERVLGTDPSDGRTITAKFGKFGAFVQKGDGDDKVCASLGKGQLIENLTLEDALKLFSLPRTVGKYRDKDVVAAAGKFGPYIKWDGNNISLPKKTNPVNVDLSTCIQAIERHLSGPLKQIIAEFPGDISVINGNYGPYIKHDGKNYKIPAGKEASALTKEDCEAIISAGQPTIRKGRRR